MGNTNALLQVIAERLQLMQPTANVTIGDEQVFNAVQRQLENGREFSVA